MHRGGTIAASSLLPEACQSITASQLIKKKIADSPIHLFKVYEGILPIMSLYSDSGTSPLPEYTGQHCSGLAACAD